MHVKFYEIAPTGVGKRRAGDGYEARKSDSYGWQAVLERSEGGAGSLRPPPIPPPMPGCSIRCATCWWSIAMWRFRSMACRRRPAPISPMMVLHAHAVARGAPASKIVVELPHASWTHSLDLAYETSLHMLREVECCGVLLPLETVAIETIRHLASCKVPVIARADIAMPEEAGLGAQFTAAEREWHAIQVVNDARAVAEAGAFAIFAIPARTTSWPWRSAVRSRCR